MSELHNDLVAPTWVGLPTSETCPTAPTAGERTRALYSLAEPEGMGRQYLVVELAAAALTCAVAVLGAML